jgi:hypothetical protein
MKKITKLLVALLVVIASIDFLWFFFPEVISRKYAIVLTIPIITICYFLYVEVKDTLYLLALGGFMIADYYFFIEKNLAYGIVSSGISLSIYGIIVLRQSHYISTRRLLISTVPFLTIYMLPFILFVEKISDEIFGEVIFYSFAIGYFSFMSFMAYISQRTLVTKRLALAGLSTALMGIVFGTYLFIDRKPIYSVLANVLFVYSHYIMLQYIILKDSRKVAVEEL